MSILSLQKKSDFKNLKVDVTDSFIHAYLLAFVVPAGNTAAISHLNFWFSETAAALKKKFSFNTILVASLSEFII